ncbi:hypothetical protein CJ030_MR0G005029 [Morella rubra]|uniref:Uncharacterized protein n=1 Tax=Morella rubra TaxID=262757 RepID=A0A6A1ULR3_9ROSI|nr:hypothetical protein CJ030_MR0G005029 [Morella rubra]
MADGEFLRDTERELVHVDPLAVSFLSDDLEGKSWVLDMVSSVGYLVGVSSEGHEELRNLFAALESDRVHLSSKKSRKSGGKC